MFLPVFFVHLHHYFLAHVEVFITIIISRLLFSCIEIRGANVLLRLLEFFFLAFLKALS